MSLPNSDNINAQRFRILVIGNANAGKTTILEKVCHANGRKPVYLDGKGDEIESELNPSASRGEHDIEHEFQYPSAHGFVFHDSRGFEAGCAVELEKVKDFIHKRGKAEQLKDQLHAIWYCLPTSNDRGMTEAETSLFESGTGNVPVIAIFTKMDALDEKARNQLFWDEVPFMQHNKQVPIRAKAMFEENYLQRLENVTHKPRRVVELRDMHKEDTNCDMLILRTSETLNRKTLELFCLSILRNDVESRIKNAISQIILPKAEEARKSGSFSNEQAKSLFCDVMYCFPHMLPSFDVLIRNMDNNTVGAAKDIVKQKIFTGLFETRERIIEFEEQRESLIESRNDLDDDSMDLLWKNFNSVLPFMPLQATYQYRTIWIGLVAVAVSDHCLFASRPRSHADFLKALNLCVNAHSYPKLMSAMKQEPSIIGDAVTVLDILKENRNTLSHQ